MVNLNLTRKLIAFFVEDKGSTRGKAKRMSSSNPVRQLTRGNQSFYTDRVEVFYKETNLLPLQSKNIDD